MIFHSPVTQPLVRLANKSRAAAAACVIKYLVADSTPRGWSPWIISGRMARVLISRPIQARNQCELAKVIVVPRPKDIKMMARIAGDISKGRIFTHIIRE